MTSTGLAETHLNFDLLGTSLLRCCINFQTFAVLRLMEVTRTIFLGIYVKSIYSRSEQQKMDAGHLL